jgi:predicted kinase
VSTLIVVGGLPATGKSTIAAAVARRTGAVYLRVDRIEQAVVDWTSLAHPVGPVGYAIAHQLAREQLSLGLDVIVECVNPAAATRDPWVQTAAGAGARIVEVELRCSDRAEHERRVATRPSDVAGLVKPTWAQIVDRDYEPWSRPRLEIDTALTSVPDATELVLAQLVPHAPNGD